MSKNSSKTEKALRLGVILPVLLLAGAAAAAPQLMSAYGDQWAWRAADINAMGGTGVALYRGGMSNLYNPALLADEASARLDAGISVDQESEDRYMPLYDTFDNVVTEVSIAANRNHFWQSGFGYARNLGEQGVPLTVGVALADRYPFQYKFSEEIRNPDTYATPPVRDVLLANRTREVEGTLRDLSVGVGAQVADRISVGAAFHYAFGTRTDTWRVRDFDTLDGDSSYAQVYEQDLDGINVTLGVRGVINERIEIGASWESPLKACGDFSDLRTGAAGVEIDQTAAGHVQYPQVFRGGLTFRPRTDPATVFTMELEYVPWSDLKDTRFPGDDNPQDLSDTIDVRIGLQHLFYNGMPVRFGFRHYDSYVNDEISGSAFSGGVGMPFGSGMFSVSLELSKVTALMDHQFPYDFGPAYHADDIARVEDTRFRVGVGYTLDF